MSELTLNSRPTGEMSDDELIALAKNGNSVALEALIVRYRGLIRKQSLKYQIRSGGDSNDLIQEGTLGFINAVYGYSTEKGKPFIVFATACIANKVKDVMRAYNSNKNVVLNTADSIVFDDSAEEKYADALASNDPLAAYISEDDDNKFYEQTRAVLSKKQYSVLELYLEGYPYPAIAEKLGINIKSVDNALTTAKSKLKKIYLTRKGE